MRSALLVLVVVAAPAVGALSEECRKVDAAFAQLPASERLGALAARGCLGGDADTDEATRRFVRDLPDVRRAGGDERKFIVQDELAELAKSAERARLEKLAQAIAAARALVLADADPRTRGLHQAELWDWDRQSGEFPPMLGIELKSVDYATSQQIVRLATLTKRALTYYAMPVLDAAAKEAARRHAMWTSYFDDARMQYFHELWLNGKLWAQRAKERRGFAEPPNDQLIVLHPNVGLEYIRGAPAGSRLEPTVFLEIIGYNRWRYDPATSKVSGGLGASLIRAYTDAAGVQSTANGLMVHWKQRYSAALTRRDGKTGLVLSIDLGSLLSKTGQDMRDTVRFARPFFD